jgi:hypothetical protein
VRGLFALATVVGRKANCGNKNCDSPQPERLAGELKSGEAVDCVVAEMKDMWFARFSYTTY